MDSHSGIIEALNYALVRTGYRPFDEAEANQRMGFSLEDTLRDKIAEKDMHRVCTLYREYYHKISPLRTRVFPGVVDTLRRLDRMGIRCAIASNKPRYSAIHLLEALGLHQYFPVVVGGECVPLPKPDPGMILLAMSRLGASPENTIYVGDSEVDAIAGRSAGLEVIVVLNGIRSLWHNTDSGNGVRMLRHVSDIVGLVDAEEDPGACGAAAATFQLSRSSSRQDQKQAGREE